MDAVRVAINAVHYHMDGIDLGVEKDGEPLSQVVSTAASEPLDEDWAAVTQRGDHEGDGDPPVVASELEAFLTGQHPERIGSGGRWRHERLDITRSVSKRYAIGREVVRPKVEGGVPPFLSSLDMQLSRPARSIPEQASLARWKEEILCFMPLDP